MPTRYYKTEGLIIKKTPFGEADFLVRFFADRFGKIDVLARGARKSASKLNAHLDFLNYVRFSFVKNGERLPTLTDAEIINRNDHLIASYEAMAFLRRIAKTIDIMIPQEQEDDALLEQLKRFLTQTAVDLINPNWAIQENIFLSELFAHEGYGPEARATALPSEVANSIMKLWPALKI